ncbi:hypothetical protein T265_02988 [Opisthorchis viverrini]|uniref:Helix-turn-helix domain-containing protein n=1 Tax=Opisthorchis viverrini TaxID=6198 RepID=A0A075AHX4_OPIVI|nr:hypothetical protein T265_02988 [Opisthorchis viverrini]KER30639.1 hypothetical protein T265_02988 [Opisthorchis viverrini]
MESPISPILANMYMEDFEQKALNGFECPRRVFWRYVDDTFVVIKRDKVDEFFQHLNTLNPHIKFSMELESTSGTLAFLDCMTRKSNGKLKTTVYRKSTDSCAVLNCSSAHPKVVYASIASAMFRRVRSLCTEEVDQRAAQPEVKKRLRDSGYPVGLIKRQLRQVLVPTPRPNKEWIGTVVIPYKAGTSEVIRRVLNTANSIVAFQKGKTLRSVLVHLKDRLPVDRTRNCVYKMKCNDCTKVCIGQTARELHTRIGEHKRSTNRPPRNAEALVKDSAMAGHALDAGHRIGLENMDILRRGLRFTPQRLVAEAVEVAKRPSKPPKRCGHTVHFASSSEVCILSGFSIHSEKWLSFSLQNDPAGRKVEFLTTILLNPLVRPLIYHASDCAATLPVLCQLVAHLVNFPSAISSKLISLQRGIFRRHSADCDSKPPKRCGHTVHFASSSEVCILSGFSIHSEKWLSFSLQNDPAGRKVEFLTTILLNPLVRPLIYHASDCAATLPVLCQLVAHLVNFPSAISSKLISLQRGIFRRHSADCDSAQSRSVHNSDMLVSKQAEDVAENADDDEKDKDDASGGKHKKTTLYTKPRRASNQ